MTRFEFKLKVNFIDEETGEEIYHKVLIDNSNGNEIGFDDMVGLLNEQHSTIKQLESDKAIAEDYVNIFEMENVKLRKKLNNYKATVLGFIWIMEQNGRISGKNDDFVKDLFKLIE